MERRRPPPADFCLERPGIGWPRHLLLVTLLRRCVHLGKPVVLRSTVMHLQLFLQPRRFLQMRLPHRKAARVFHVKSHTGITAARTQVPRLLMEIAYFTPPGTTPR